MLSATTLRLRAGAPGTVLLRAATNVPADALGERLGARRAGR